MKFKNLIGLCSVLLFLFLTVGIVTATENIGDTILIDENGSELCPESVNSGGDYLGAVLKQNNEINFENNISYEGVLGESNDNEILEASFSDKNFNVTFPDKIYAGQPFQIKIQLLHSIKNINLSSQRLDITIQKFSVKNTYKCSINRDGTSIITIDDYFSPGEDYQLIIYDRELHQYPSSYHLIQYFFKVLPEPPKALISLSNYKTYYNSGKITIKVTDSATNKGLANKKLKVRLYETSGEDLITEYGYTDSNGKYNVIINYRPDDYKMIVDLEDENYSSKELSAKITVLPTPIKVSVNKVNSYAGLYTVLSAKVQSKGKSMNSGTITFFINAKAYKATVKNGKAQVIVKLPKAKTYSYEAYYFKDLRYEDSSGYSKVVVKKTPAKIPIKIGKYVCKITRKEYNLIQKAKIKGTFSKKYYTGKTIRYNVYNVKKVTYTKKKIYMDSWATGYKTYSGAFDAPNGYTYYGTEAKLVGNHVKRYVVYKKTSYNKVLVKTPQTKVYIIVDSSPRWGVTAHLCHLKYVLKEYDGGVISENYISSYKKIF